MESDLISFLLSEDAVARGMAFECLSERYGAALEYDVDADLSSRRVSVERWQAGR